MKVLVDMTYKMGKRIVIGVIGGTMLLIGVVMLVTPGPGIAAIAAGLAILAIEFAWARVWLKRLRRKFSDAGAAFRNGRINGHLQRYRD